MSKHEKLVVPADESGGKGKLYGRIALYGVLGVLLVLGLLDYNAKTSAAATAKSWGERLDLEDLDSRLRKGNHAQYIQGKPTKTESKVTDTFGNSNEVFEYKWSGIIRSYAVRLTFSGGSNPMVIKVE